VATRAARALDGHEDDDPATALVSLRARLKVLAREQRFEDAARLRDRMKALEEAVRTLEELDRLRRLQACLVVPAREPGFVRVYAVTGGRVAATRRLPIGSGALHEAAALVRDASVDVLPTTEDADELQLVGSFLAKPPPELRQVPLEPSAILGAVVQAA
jgi:DNA polymerase-3 subunit epsilon